MRPVRKPLCRGGPGFNGLLIELGLEPRSYVESRIRINNSREQLGFASPLLKVRNPGGHAQADTRVEIHFE